MSWPMPSSDIEIYPMPSFPTLAVSDLARSGRWYQEALGFQHIFTMPSRDGTPMLIHLRWAKYADLLLVPQQQAPEVPLGAGVTLGYGIQQGTADELAERARAAGVAFLEGPVDRLWNTRELIVADPDGYRLAFSQGPLLPDLGWEALGRRLQGHNENEHEGSEESEGSRRGITGTNAGETEGTEEMEVRREG